MFYLYRHIRLDTGTPFYIGIGKKCKPIMGWKTEHRRAYQKTHRNKLWENIVNKAGYDVEIIMESKDPIFIKKKEIEFILLYGRKDLKTGLLINNTDGGDGRLTPNIESMMNVGKNLIPYVTSKRRRVYQYNLAGIFIKEWNSITEAYKHYNLSASTGIIMCCKGKINYYLGYQWSYTYRGIFIGTPKPQNRNYKPIGRFCMISGELLETFGSAMEAEINGGYNRKSIGNNLNKLSKSANGFKWNFLKLK